MKSSPWPLFVGTVGVCRYAVSAVSPKRMAPVLRITSRPCCTANSQRHPFPLNRRSPHSRPVPRRRLNPAAASFHAECTHSPENPHHSHPSSAMSSRQGAGGKKHGSGQAKKGRGRPPAYVWKDNEVLTEAERRLKISIEKRRERQKKSYYKKKSAKQQEAHATGSSQIPDYILDDYSAAAAGRSSWAKSGSSSKDTPLVVVREYHGYP